MSMAAGGEMVRAGRTRPLAAGGDVRLPSLPNVPLLKELGFSNNFSFSGFAGLLAPVRTPPPILDRLAEVFAVAARKPETLRKLRALDTIPAYLDPTEFKAQIERGLRDWTEIAERLNLAVEG
jgi:tripartite-type tricarboxylate transporter receptor subunit TctC